MNSLGKSSQGRDFEIIALKRSWVNAMLHRKSNHRKEDVNNTLPPKTKQLKSKLDRIVPF